MDNRKLLNRVIFEFGGQNSMMLMHEKALNRITFDHLSPSQSSLWGIYEYYGADFTYDAYQWQNDKWTLIKEVYPQFSDPKKRTEKRVQGKGPLKESDAIDKKNSKIKDGLIVPN